MISTTVARNWTIDTAMASSPATRRSAQATTTASDQTSASNGPIGRPVLRPKAARRSAIRP
jgi:hypothetical protein